MDWLSDNLWSAWLGAGMLLAAAEMLSLDLVLIMLAIGAFVGAATALLGAPVLLQVLLAAGAAGGTIFLLRPPLIAKLHSGPTLKTGHQNLLGSQGTVTEPITALEPGRVKLSGDVWSALPYEEGITIDAGQTVEVLQIDGATAYVQPIPALEP